MRWWSPTPRPSPTRWRPFPLLPAELFPPRLANSEEELNSLVWEKVHRLYGEDPPKLIVDRLNVELGGILGKYDVVYMSAQKLVQRSLENGYLVGSRGSVGSSLVAYMSGITEVNKPSAPLPLPQVQAQRVHHRRLLRPAARICRTRVCPVCGTKYVKDGFDIPFETFLGFGGGKVPDIDLNFSGEYQARAHRHAIEMFGETQVFRAGTIGTLAEKTAYGFVKKYLEENGMTVGRAEENRLTIGCVGVRRTTGQHPGGLVVVPDDMDMEDFCPVQHPADADDSDTVTTHFEYHSMEANLLKLDMLGHDDPTMVRMMQDLTGVDPHDIPLDDPDTMSIFTSSRVLGYENDEIQGPTGAVAIPEFKHPVHPADAGGHPAQGLQHPGAPLRLLPRHGRVAGQRPGSDRQRHRLCSGDGGLPGRHHALPHQDGAGPQDELQDHGEGPKREGEEGRL